jgi:hypothetical protein
VLGRRLNLVASVARIAVSGSICAFRQIVVSQAQWMPSLPIVELVHCSAPIPAIFACMNIMRGCAGQHVITRGAVLSRLRRKQSVELEMARAEPT